MVEDVASVVHVDEMVLHLVFVVPMASIAWCTRVGGCLRWFQWRENDHNRHLYPKEEGAILMVEDVARVVHVEEVLRRLHQRRALVLEGETGEQGLGLRVSQRSASRTIIYRRIIVVVLE